MYRHAEGDWTIGSTPGEKLVWLRNQLTTETVPTSGWQVFDGERKLFLDDPTLTVTSGPLSETCNNFTISASGQAAKERGK